MTSKATDLAVDLFGPDSDSDDDVVLCDSLFSPAFSPLGSQLNFSQRCRKLTVHGQSLRVEERNPTRTAATSSSGATSGSGRDRDGASGRNRERNGRDGRDNGKERGGDRERGDRNRSSGGGEGKAGSGGRGGGSKSSGGAAGKTN